jgi:hypothetical protein
MKSNIDALRNQRSMYISDDAIEHRHDELDLVYYVCKREVARPGGGSEWNTVVVGYEGRRIKPSFNICFQNDERYKAYIQRWIECRKLTLDEKQARRDQRKLIKTSLKEGSILSCSWGYEQTNVEFWQVIKKKSDKTVVIQEIDKKLTDNPDDHNYNGMAGQVIPVPNVFKEKSEPLVKRVSVDDQIRLESFRFLHPWDGKPEYCSWYG